MNYFYIQHQHEVLVEELFTKQVKNDIHINKKIEKPIKGAHNKHLEERTT
jgi:hypothetical protein